MLCVPSSMSEAHITEASNTSILTRSMKALLRVDGRNISVTNSDPKTRKEQDHKRKLALEQADISKKKNDNIASLIMHDLYSTSLTLNNSLVHSKSPSTNTVTDPPPAVTEDANKEFNASYSVANQNLNSEFLSDSLSDFDLDIFSPGTKQKLNCFANSANPISSPKYHSTQIPRTMEDKVNEILRLQDDYTNKLVQLSEKVDALDFNSSQSLAKLTRRIEIIENKLNSNNLSLNERIDGVFNYVDERIDTFTQIYESANLEQQFKLAYDHIDKQLEVATNEWKRAQTNPDDLQVTVAGLVDQQIKLSYDHLDPKSDEHKGIVEDFVNQCMKNKQLDLSPDSTLVTAIHETAQKLFEANSVSVRNELETLQEKQRQLDLLISEVNTSLSFLADPSTTSIPSTYQNVLDKKIEKLTCWSGQMQTQINLNSVNIESHDINRRKSNLIIEGFEELPGEDLKGRLVPFLSHFVPYFHPNWLSIVYRLGKVGDDLSSSPSPRKVMISFTTLEAKEHVLAQAGIIARAGEPGRRIFINEDVSEVCKRKRADIRKYASFLSEKGIAATQKGDGIIINDVFHTFEDLQYMPKGLTLRDSRTFVKGNIWAFQSCYSPLSNLYKCTIKRNGIAYPSSEHAYQHTKAVENHDFIRARSILAQPSAYEAMAIAKGIKVQQQWLDTRQLIVMEEILRQKKEQVPEFANELRDSANHRLVEYTRSYFWGAGHPTSINQVYEGAFRGRNQLGKFLEKVRSEF